MRNLLLIVWGMTFTAWIIVLVLWVRAYRDYLRVSREHQKTLQSLIAELKKESV